MVGEEGWHFVPSQGDVPAGDAGVVSTQLRHDVFALALGVPSAPRRRECLCSRAAVTYNDVAPPQTILSYNPFRGLVSIRRR